MLFNSYIFVLGFLPLCLAGYFLLNRAGWKRAALIFLLGMSLWFYGANTPKYLILIVSSVLVNYGFYRLSAAITGDKLRRAAKLAAVAVNLGVLFYFKYYDFFAETVNFIFRSDWTLRHVVLPLGISFFTFQQISFVVDAFNGEVKDCSLLDYACFVTFFPSLSPAPSSPMTSLSLSFRTIRASASTVKISRAACTSSPSVWPEGAHCRQPQPRRSHGLQLHFLRKLGRHGQHKLPHCHAVLHPANVL